MRQRARPRWRPLRRVGGGNRRQVSLLILRPASNHRFWCHLRSSSWPSVRIAKTEGRGTPPFLIFKFTILPLLAGRHTLRHLLSRVFLETAEGSAPTATAVAGGPNNVTSKSACTGRAPFRCTGRCAECSCARGTQLFKAVPAPDRRSFTRAGPIPGSQRNRPAC